MPAPRGLAAAALVAVLPVTACGQGTPSGEVPGGAVGPDEQVSERIEVLQVQLEYPLDGVYEVGEDARLFLAVANDGEGADALVDVTGPDFAEAELTSGGKTGPIPVPELDNVYIGAEGAPSVVLEDLSTALRSSQSIPVTLVFDDAGEVTVEAVVAAEGQTPAPPFDFPDPAEDVSPDS
jgi:hypothetical protein